MKACRMAGLLLFEGSPTPMLYAGWCGHCLEMSELPIAEVRQGIQPKCGNEGCGEDLVVFRRHDSRSRGDVAGRRIAAPGLKPAA
jgi:hypothetical protein